MATEDIIAGVGLAVGLIGGIFFISFLQKRGICVIRQSQPQPEPQPIPIAIPVMSPLEYSIKIEEIHKKDISEDPC